MQGLVTIGEYEALSTNWCRDSSGWGLVRINVRAPEQVAPRREQGVVIGGQQLYGWKLGITHIYHIY